MFEFKCRAVKKDPSGYFHPRWDQAENITVYAETKAEAVEKIKTVLGESSWPWVVHVDLITEKQT